MLHVVNNLYTTFWDVPATAVPPTEGEYPHAYVKGYFNDAGFVDTGKDGTCDKMDAATQWMDCGIPCPVGDEARMSSSDLTGFTAAVLAFMFLCALIGAVAFKLVGKNTEQFFVGGRSLNLFVVTATLASQSLDANAALGNVDLGFKYHWWDGACLPIGLGLSLILNGIFFAGPLNEMKLLTLPDVFARKFGPACEVLSSFLLPTTPCTHPLPTIPCTLPSHHPLQVLFSFLAIISFLFLLGGNLVGAGATHADPSVHSVCSVHHPGHCIVCEHRVSRSAWATSSRTSWASTRRSRASGSARLPSGCTRSRAGCSPSRTPTARRR